MRPLAAALALALAGPARARYGPDPVGVPGDFKCAWRKLAVEYLQQKLPDLLASVHQEKHKLTFSSC